MAKSDNATAPVTTPAAAKTRKPRTAKPKSAEQIIMKHVRSVSVLMGKLDAAHGSIPDEHKSRVLAVVSAMRAPTA